MNWRNCNDRGNELWRCGYFSRKDSAFVQELQEQVRGLGPAERHGGAG